MESHHEYDLEINEEKHAYSILESFRMMRENEEYSHFTIKVGDEEMKVNRDLMIAASGYISAMFAHDMVEKNTGVLEMKDVEFSLVKKCIDFIYTGKLSISFDGCENLLYVSCLMQLWTLREHIGRFLKDFLSVSTFFKIWNLSQKFSVQNLEESCCKFAHENLEMVAKEKEFAKLEVGAITLFLSVKKSSAPGGEDRKLVVLLQWIKNDTRNRLQHLVMLLKSVELKFVSQAYSRMLIESEPMIFESAECARMFCLATMDNSHSAKRQRLDLKYAHIANTPIVFDAQSQTLKALKLGERSSTEICALHPNMANKDYCAVAVGNHVYVVMEDRKVFRLNVFETECGWVEMVNLYAKKCWVSHPASAASTSFVRVRQPRPISAAVLNQHIYVAAGNSFGRYSLRDDRWEMIGSDGISLEAPCLVAHLDEIYNIGCSEVSAKKYSPQSESWTPFAPFPGDRYRGQGDLCSVSLSHKIYALNSSFSDECFFSYSKTTDAWTQSTPLDFDGAKLCICNNMLFAIPSSYPDCLYVYVTNKWKDIKHDGNDWDLRSVASIWLPK